MVGASLHRASVTVNELAANQFVRSACHSAGLPLNLHNRAGVFFFCSASLINELVKSGPVGVTRSITRRLHLSLFLNAQLYNCARFR
jgi:hypothetical protein